MDWTGGECHAKGSSGRISLTSSTLVPFTRFRFFDGFMCRLVYGCEMDASGILNCYLVGGEVSLCFVSR